MAQIGAGAVAAMQGSGTEIQRSQGMPSSNEIELVEAAIVDEHEHQGHLVPLLITPSALEGPWLPTGCGKGWMLAESDVPFYRKKLISDYRNIRLAPYLPQVWTSRAATLVRLGYAELAIADAYKARLLLKALSYPAEDFLAIPTDLTKLKNKVLVAFMTQHQAQGDKKGIEYTFMMRNICEKVHQRTFLLMATALHCVTAGSDAVLVLQKGLKRFPKHEELVSRLKQAKEVVQQYKDNLIRTGHSNTDVKTLSTTGGLYRRAYPWIMPDELHRSAKKIKAMRLKFEGSTAAQVTLAPSPLDSGSEKGLGVFANSEIQAGEEILLDKSIFGVRASTDRQFCEACCDVVQDPGVSPKCCDAKFCDESCKDGSFRNYHKTLHEQNFEYLHDSCNNARQDRSTTVALLMTKILATALQLGISPLKLPVISPLKVDYDCESISFFKLQDNVITPIRILRSIGADIFTDPHFDTWVIQTLFWRIEANSQRMRFEASEPVMASINPMLSMFNHDCDPGAAWTCRRQSANCLKVTALRRIQKGEEICISYCDHALQEKDRRQRIAGRIGKICECRRCLQERVEAENLELCNLMAPLKDEGEEIVANVDT